MKKYTVIVRLKVKGSRHSVTGYSSYDSKAYDGKFKNAVLNAVYIDFSNRRKRFKYDSDYDYDLLDSKIMMPSGTLKKTSNKDNRRLKKELIGTKIEDKSITKAERAKELHIKLSDASESKRDSERRQKSSVFSEKIKDEKMAQGDYMKLSKRLKGKDKKAVVEIAKEEGHHAQVLKKIDAEEYKAFLAWKKKNKS